MFTRALNAFLVCLLLSCSLNAHAKGSDGLVLLKGVIHSAVDSGDSVSFKFTGSLSFKFFSAAQGDPSRTQVDLNVEVHDLRVVVPAFGEKRGSSDDPYVVNFANVVTHSVEASKSGEMVSIVLFNPTLSFNISGVLEKAGCSHAQVMPDRLERQLRK
jgi:hypothetical protein